jgi:hypothetical protein
MHGISNGPNGRALNDTVAETGPGFADDAVLEGELRPGDLAAETEAAAERLKRSGWVRDSAAALAAAPEDDEGDETQAHPS